MEPQRAPGEAGDLKQFTGKDSGFEEPEGEAELVLDTDANSAEESANILHDFINDRLAG